MPRGSIVSSSKAARSSSTWAVSGSRRPTSPGTLEQGRLDCVNVYNGEVHELHDVSFLTYATPRSPNLALHQEVQALGLSTFLVGDCRAPRIVLTATAEGYRAAMEL